MTKPSTPSVKRLRKPPAYHSAPVVTWGVTLSLACTEAGCPHRARITSAEHPTDAQALQSAYDMARLEGWQFVGGLAYCRHPPPQNAHQAMGEEERWRHRLPPELEFQHLEKKTPKQRVNPLIALAQRQAAKVAQTTARRNPLHPIG